VQRVGGCMCFEKSPSYHLLLHPMTPGLPHNGNLPPIPLQSLLLEFLTWISTPRSTENTVAHFNKLDIWLLLTTFILVCCGTLLIKRCLSRDLQQFHQACCNFLETPLHIAFALHYQSHVSSPDQWKSGGSWSDSNVPGLE